MKFEELILLLPCHSLEDFPLYHTGDEAEGLLAGWSALWHPALLHAAGRLPSWYRADGTPEDLSNRLIIVPQVSESLLPAGWAARAKNEGATVLRKTHKRPALVDAALTALDGGDAGVDADLAADFLALGYCYLQVELLIRQLRQYSNLDEMHLKTQSLFAAEAAVAHDREKARAHLQQCFDALCESRERCYPATSYLLDLTLVAPTTLGDALKAEIERPSVTNLLVSAEVIETLAAQQPDTLNLLRERWKAGGVDLVGGEFHESDSPNLPLEAVRRNLLAGRASYEKHLGEVPTTFGRRRYGLAPWLPQLLSRIGFAGALHFTLDDGQFPKADQSKTSWEGVDRSVIAAVAKVPLDAAEPTSFLSLPEKLGESMDMDHVAVLVFAHWPGMALSWYEDLRRIARFAPVLGKFVSFQEFFRDTDAPGRVSTWTPEEYRAPYLKQSIIRRKPDPLSAVARHWRRQWRLQTAVAAATLGALANNEVAAAWNADDAARLAREIDRCASPLDDPAAEDLDTRLTIFQRSAEAQFARLPRGKGPAGEGWLVVNPTSANRVIGVEIPGMTRAPAIDGPVRAAQPIENGMAVIVETPPMGYVWVASNPLPAPPVKQARAMAEPTVLRNEVMEVTIDPKSGGIRSIRDTYSRENRLSQQLSLRSPGPRLKPGEVWRDPDEDAVYGRTIADEVKVTSTGPAFGEIVSRGKIVDGEDKPVATFTQATRLWRFSRVVEVRATIQPDEQPKSDPWNSYYCARFAWNDPGADLFRSAGEGMHKTDAKRLESPLVIETREEKRRTAIFAGGMPYHKRQGMRMLDTLLISRGETQREFRFGIGIDVEQPMVEAMTFLAPPLVIHDANGPPPVVSPACWLFHVDLKNVVATAWEPLIEEGRGVGVRTRLLETAGRAANVRLRSFRAPGTARQTNYAGETLAELPIDGDAVRVNLNAFEWAEVEVRWK